MMIRGTNRNRLSDRWKRMVGLVMISCITDDNNQLGNVHLLLCVKQSVPFHEADHIVIAESFQAFEHFLQWFLAVGVRL